MQERDLELRVDELEEDAQLIREKVAFIDSHIDEIYRLIAKIANLITDIVGD